MLIKMIHHVYVMILVNHFCILKNYQTWMTYEVNCSIYWYDFLYDFVMLHVCYIYCDILNYDVIMSHHTYSYINYQFSVHTI